MPRIITALFEDRGKADGALQALVTGGIARDRIAILGEDHQRASELAPTRSVRADDSALPDISLPREDLELYAEGLRRGCIMVTARIDGERFEDAIATLDMFDPVDLDSRAKEWLQVQGDASPGGVDVGGPLGAGLSGGVSGGTTNTSALPGSGQLADSTHDVGSADLRIDEARLGNQGRSTDTTVGDRRADDRAGMPGTLELGAPGPDLFRRETTRSGRVRSYVR